MLYKEVVVDDKMMPALSGINTLSKEKSVFLCYTRKSWSMTDDACFVRDQHAK